ncbi:MAG: UDP-glucose--hexose-1-phosphate uridylyltransferase [Ruminococcaceae bacterium]|nr:UDP-glucose--hexose-1-phosphate uridylyltransferase [Oscillospiraceae bacterium]
MNIYVSIKKLVTYGINCGLLDERDKTYTINLLIDALGIDSFEEPALETENINLEQTLNEILEYAVENGLCEDSVTYRDLFDTRVMSLLMPRPSEVTQKFWELYKISPKDATNYFYKLSGNSNYIRRYRVEKDKKWISSTPYGNIDITINLSKPEKDPKAIAAAKAAPQSGYPKCALCRENEGYAGRVNSPARQNHRIIPVTINDSDWFMQYSPYVYYNEHCIVFNSQHTPMKIDRSTFKKLLDFVELFPHYFVGSNADLPIVGGSILSHDHFQGGNYDFAMAKAPMEKSFSFNGFDDVEAGIVKWPMSTIRLRSKSADSLVCLADKILNSWRAYSDESAFIFSHTNDEPHNTITPIARMKNGCFELDLVLRNNLTTPEHPLGVYHPHSELHNIKKENIGLIEVMGLAVLPARLNSELDELADAIINKKDISSIDTIKKHSSWVNSFVGNYDNINSENIQTILQDEVGKVFLLVLEHAGVFKRDDEGKKAFDRFINQIL